MNTGCTAGIFGIGLIKLMEPDGSGQVGLPVIELDDRKLGRSSLTACNDSDMYRSEQT
jgi:hypothetical protein